MKTADEVMTEWALDEIVFECGENGRTFTKEEFKLICAYMTAILNPSTFELTADIKRIALPNKGAALNDLRGTVMKYMHSMAALSDGKERFWKVLSLRSMLMFESCDEFRRFMFRDSAAGWGVSEEDKIPVSGWDKIFTKLEEMLEVDPLGKPPKCT